MVSYVFLCSWVCVSCPCHVLLSQSEQSPRLGSEVFSIPALMGSTSPAWAPCLALRAPSFSTILDLTFLAGDSQTGIFVVDAQNQQLFPVREADASLPPAGSLLWEEKEETTHVVES